jgi:hypothetical protein
VSVLPAVVVMTHADPVHLRRLVGALDPWPVFLHVDVRTTDDVYAAMVEGLPDRVTLLPRIMTGWARFENVTAEIEGYRAALANPGVTHVLSMTGTDYPLAATSTVEAYLAGHPGFSFAENWDVPDPDWGGRSGGMARLRYPHWAWRKRMIRVPVPRRLPKGLHWAAGSQMKLLTREHATALVRAYDERPDLVRFFRRTWCADESFVPTILATDSLVPGFQENHVHDVLWFIDWRSEGKSPKWLGVEDLPRIRNRRYPSDGRTPRFFGRKFGPDTAVLDVIDAELRQP